MRKQIQAHHNPLHWICDGFFDGWLLVAMFGSCTRCRPARNWRQFKLLKLTQQIFRPLLYAHYECFALSVSVHCVFGECAIRRASNFWYFTFDHIILIDFKGNLLTFGLFIIQNVKLAVMRAHSCRWLISRYAQGRAFFYCVVFSFSFGDIDIDWARRLLQVERHSQHASGCGKRETRRPETVATIIGLQMRPLSERVWDAGSHGPTSQTQVVGWDTVCRSC